MHFLIEFYKGGLPPPDFMIIHHIGNMVVPHPPIELHGFPPWQTTLTEFQCVRLANQVSGT